jgi:hypothetical protein
MLKFNMFAVNAVAIVLEAFPFLLAGSILGSLIERFLPEKIFRNKIFQRGGWGMLITLFLGVLFPTCECGVIPVARKLAKKGLPQHLAVVYMFAAPVINPVVIIATYVAFRFKILMVLGRIAISAVTAIAIGMVMSLQKDFFKDNVIKQVPDTDLLEDGNCCHEGYDRSSSSFFQLIGHFTEEFIEMSKYLIAGAIFASAYRIFIPKSIALFFEPSQALSILFMMVLAIILSICSEADAFVASSFMRFSPFAQLSFVTIGPVLDLKLLLMYSGTLKKKALILIIIVPIVIIYILCNILGLIAG